LQTIRVSAVKARFFLFFLFFFGPIGAVAPRPLATLLFWGQSPQPPGAIEGLGAESSGAAAILQLFF